MAAVNNKGISAALGDTLVCTMALSPGYREGETYEVVANDRGTLGLWGRDGFFDPLNMLVSSFRKVNV